MPLYDYECTHCHSKTEELADYEDTKVLMCDKCSTPTCERCVSAPAQFNGLPTPKFH